MYWLSAERVWNRIIVLLIYLPASRLTSRSKTTISLVNKYLLILLFALCTNSAFAADQPLRYLNDWRWEGPSAAFLLALDNGYYSDAGLAVTMDPGKGSVDGLDRVESGEYDMASVDINSLVRFKDKNPDSKLKAIFVIYNAPPFAIIGRRSLGVVGPQDLEGHKLGAPAADGAYAQWPAFVDINRIKEDEVAIESVSFADREEKLMDGQVDAITGFSFTSMLGLTSRGVAINDLSLMLMSDFGLDLYGNVIIVNPEFAANNPAAVRGFIKASTQGLKETVANPAQAIKHVLSHNDGAEEETELDRLVMAIGLHIVTDEVREHGLGAIQMGRLEKSIEQLSKSYEFTNRPQGSDIFEDVYLPAKDFRMLVSVEEAAANSGAVPPPEPVTE